MKTQNVSLKASEKISLIGNLSTMLSAGIPILEAVDSLLEDVKGGQKKILETLKNDLVRGERVYVTLSKFPRTFDKVTVNVIRASEEAGTLGKTLKDLKANIRREAEFTDKIRSALIYPLFIMGVFAMVMILILFFVIPRVATVFGRLKVELPLPTKALLFVSNILVQNTLLVIFLTAITIAISVFLFKRNRKAFMNVFYSLPLISGVVKQVDLTRFSRSLYLLLYSGMPITRSLELTEDVVSKREIAKVIKNSREMILAGKSLSEGFQQAKGTIPTIVIKLIEAGEKTGTLDKSMKEISLHLDYEVTSRLKTLTALIEPIMLVFVGITVGGMMMAIIAPIYGLISQVGSL